MYKSPIFTTYYDIHMTIHGVSHDIYGSSADAVGQRGNSQGRRHATLWQREQRAGALGEVGWVPRGGPNCYGKTLGKVRNSLENIPR